MMGWRDTWKRRMKMTKTTHFTSTFIYFLSSLITVESIVPFMNGKILSYSLRKCSLSGLLRA